MVSMRFEYKKDCIKITAHYGSSFSGNIIDNNKLKEVADKHGLELIIAPFDPNIYFLRDIDENPIAIIDEAFYRDKEEKGATIVIESFRHLLLEDILAIFKD